MALVLSLYFLCGDSQDDFPASLDFFLGAGPQGDADPHSHEVGTSSTIRRAYDGYSSCSLTGQCCFSMGPATASPRFPPSSTDPTRSPWLDLREVP
jgi:hypothetical protein